MFEYLDHPSEELIRVSAPTIEEVFTDSGKALFELMTNTEGIKANQSFKIQVSAAERPLLLIEWLNRLILLHEVENVFLNTFQIDEIHNEAGSWTVDAIVMGEKIHPQMERRLHVKSATYGQLQWNDLPGGYQVQFVVDV